MKGFYLTLTFIALTLSLEALPEEEEEGLVKFLFTPLLKVIDVKNEKVYDGTNKNLQKLLEREDVRQAAIRDGRLSPTFLEHFLREHPRAGRSVALSKKMFNVIRKESKKVVFGPLTTRSCTTLLALFSYTATKGLKQLARAVAKEDEQSTAVDMVKSIEDLNNMTALPLNLIVCDESNVEKAIGKILDTPLHNTNCAIKASKRKLQKEKNIRDQFLKMTNGELEHRIATLRTLLKKTNRNEIENTRMYYLQDNIYHLRRFIMMANKGCDSPYRDFQREILLEVPLKENEQCYKNILGFVTYGKDCMPQRMSCMDKTQKTNFNKIDNFIKEDPEKNEWLVKLPILDLKENKYTTDYKYKKGNYYKIEGKLPAIDKNPTMTQTRKTSKLTQNYFSIPAYYMKKNNRYENLDINNNKSLKRMGIKKPNYPFFRPTDQCSVPIANTQAVGGVCFQEACKQHDYCFQTLRPKGTNWKEHFTKCNSNFKDNIGKLCDANIKSGFFGTLKNDACHTGKKVFHTAVQDGEGIFNKNNNGKSYRQSQNKQLSYSKKLYLVIQKKYCKPNENIEICNKIKTKLRRLNRINND